MINKWNVKKTLIVGATPNASRYAHAAAEMLTDFGYDIIPIGIKKGIVEGKEILDIKQRPSIKDIDTITLYIGPRHQPEWYEYLIRLKPKRIIFNPGTENPEFEKLAEANGIDVVEGCTLVMLRTNQY
jgi:predicted CoA-binding protein